MSNQLPKAEPILTAADVVFCVDSTGSMGHCIEGVKDNVRSLIEGFASDPQTTVDWRVRLVSFRDLILGEEIVEHPFTNDAAEFARQVATVRAAGGGDIPESALDAIVIALRSPWRTPSNKVVIVFTDAPPHPRLHESSLQPGQRGDLDDVINALASQRALLHIFGPEDPAYARLAKEDRVMLHRVSAGTGLAEQNFGDVMRSIGKSVSIETRTTPIVG